MSRSQNKFTDCANCYFDPSETYYVDHDRHGGWPASYDALPVSDTESTPCDCQPAVTKPRHHEDLLEASSTSVPLLAPWSGRKHRVAAWIGGSSEYAASASDLKAVTPRDGYPHHHGRRTRSSALPTVPTPRFYHVSKTAPLPPPGKKPTMLCMPLLCQVDPETAPPNRCKRLHRMKNVGVPCSPLGSPSWRRKSLSGESGCPYPYQLSYTSHGGHASKVHHKRHCAARHNTKVTEVRRSSVTMEPSVSGFSRYASSSLVDATAGRRDAISDTVAAAASKASRRCRHHLGMGFATTTTVTPDRDDIEIAVATSRRENVDVVNLSRSRRIRDEFEAGYVEGRRQGRDVVELCVSRSRQDGGGSFAQVGDANDDGQGRESVEVNVPMSLRSRENFDVGYEDYLQGHRDVELNVSRSRRSRQDFEEYLQGHEGAGLHASRSRRSTGGNYEDYRQGHGEVDVGVSRSSCRADVRCSKAVGRKKKRPREADLFYLRRRSRLHIGGSDTKMSPRSDTTTDLSALIRRNYRKRRTKAGSSTTSFSIRANARLKHGALLSPNDSAKLSLSQHLSASNLSGDDLAAVIKARSQSLDARLAAMEQDMFDKERRASLSGGSTASTTSRRVVDEPPASLLEPRVPEDVRTKRLTQEHLVKACSLSAQAIPETAREPAARDAGGDTAKDDETMNGLMASLEKIGCGHLKVNLEGLLHRLHKTDSKSTATATATPSKAKTNNSKASATKTLAADPREAYEEIYKQQSLKCILSKPKLSNKFKPKKEINFEELMKQKIDRGTLGLQVQELWTHSGNFRTATPQSSKTEQDVQPGNQTLSQTLIDGASVAGGATANEEPSLEVKFEERWSNAADPNTTRPETSGGGGMATNQRAETPRFERTWTRPTLLDEKPEVPTNMKTVQDNVRHQNIYGKLENSPRDIQQQQQQPQQHKEQNYDTNLNANQVNVEFGNVKCEQEKTSATVDPENRNPNSQQQQQQQTQLQQQQQQWVQHSSVNETNAEFREAKRQQDESPQEVQQQQQQWCQQLNANTEMFRETPRPQDASTPSPVQNRGAQPNVQQQQAQYQQQQHQQWCQRLNENQVETMRPQDANRTDARNVGPDVQADNWNRPQQQPQQQQQQQQNNFRVDSRQESWQQSRFPNSPDYQLPAFPTDQNLPERQPLGVHSIARQSFAPENGNVANNNINAHQQVAFQNRPATATQVVAELDAPQRRADDGFDVARENYARLNFEAYRTSPTDLGLPEVNSQGDWTLQANTSPMLEQVDVGGGYPAPPQLTSKPRDKWIQAPASQRGEPHLLPTRGQEGHDKWRQHGGNVPPPPQPLSPPLVRDDWFERSRKTTPQTAVVEPQPNFVYRADTSQRFPSGDCRRDMKPDYERNAKVMPVRRLVSKMADPRQNKMAVGTQQLRAQLLRREARKAVISEQARARARTTLPTNPAPLQFPVFVGNEDRVEENWKPKIRVQTKFQDLRPPTETINSKFLVSTQDGWNVQSANQGKKSKFLANAPVGSLPDDMTKLKTDYYKFWEQSQRCDPNLDVLRPTEYVSYPATEEYPTTAQVANRQCPPPTATKTAGNYRGFVNQAPTEDLPGGSCSDDEEDDGASSVQTSKSYMLHMIDQVVSRQAGSVSGERPGAASRGGGGGSYFNLAVDEAIDLVKSESLYGLDQGLCKDITQSLTDSLLGCKSVNSAASCDKCVEVAKKAQWLKEFRCDSLRNISNVVTQLQKLERVTEETHCKDHAVLFPTNVGAST